MNGLVLLCLDINVETSPVFDDFPGHLEQPGCSACAEDLFLGKFFVVTRKNSLLLVTKPFWQKWKVICGLSQLNNTVKFYLII